MAAAGAQPFHNMGRLAQGVMQSGVSECVCSVCVCVCRGVCECVFVLSPGGRASRGLGRESHPVHMTDSLQSIAEKTKRIRSRRPGVCVCSFLIFIKF